MPFLRANTLLFAVLFFSTNLLAQQDSATALPRFVLKYSPINFLDWTTPGVQFALEQHQTPKFSLQYEVGLLADFNYVTLNGDGLLGYRLRTEFRYYYDSFEKDTRTFGSNPFLSAVLMFKNTFRRTSGWFTDETGQFLELKNYTVNSWSGAVYLVWGKNRFLDKKSKWLLEYGIASGLRYLRAYRTERGGGRFDNETNDFAFNFNFENGHYFFPTTYFILKIGYVIL